VSKRISAASLAALLTSLPVLAHAQTAMVVPPIATNAAAQAAADASGPSDHANASASAAAGNGAGSGWAPAPQAAPVTASKLPPPQPGMPPKIQLLSPSAPLNAKEQRSAALATRWAARPVMPHADADGVVRFTYGTTLPTVVCAPLRVCDLALQPGEVVNDINVGDKDFWNITPGLSGPPNAPVTHFKIKPTDAGLVSNLLVDTNLRTYSVKLVSTRLVWVPLTAFTYPDDVNREWEGYRAATAGLGARGFGGGGGVSNAGDLDFGYKIGGDTPEWRPLRAYSDGSKTYIQFPHPVPTGDAPALVGLANDGGWFSSASKQVLNYRTVEDRYVVDKVLDRAVLVVGVGSSQERVTITHEKKSNR